MILQDDAIGLLVFWHRYQWTRDLSALDYPHECPSTKGYRTSRQYDSDNGAFETDARGELAERIGNIVDSITEPYRTALYVLARNRATGSMVWSSPRLPTDEIERMSVVSRAVELFSEQV